MDQSQLDRFMAKVDYEPGSTCWIWQGSKDAKGYGRFMLDGRRVPGRRPHGAHRVAYEHWVGPIPDGLHIDHLCRRPSCVNPAHLEPVTPAENTRRWALTLITVCKNGHRRTPENTYRYGDTLVCRECKNERNRRLAAELGLVHNRDKTHCPQGHEYTPETTYVKPSTGHRSCRICALEQNRRRRGVKEPHGSRTGYELRYPIKGVDAA